MRIGDRVDVGRHNRDNRPRPRRQSPTQLGRDFWRASMRNDVNAKMRHVLRRNPAIQYSKRERDLLLQQRSKCFCRVPRNRENRIACGERLHHLCHERLVIRPQTEHLPARAERVLIGLACGARQIDLPKINGCSGRDNIRRAATQQRPKRRDTARRYRPVLAIKLCVRFGQDLRR